MRLAVIVLGVVILAACSQPRPAATVPIAAPTSTRPPAIPAPAATATLSPTVTPRALQTLPATIAATDESPAFTLTAATPRRESAGRQRYALELTVPESYGRDEMVAVLRRAALSGLDAFPDANTLMVWAFTLPRNPSAGWTGQAIVSRDGKGWSASDPDDGKIHITYSPLLDPTYKTDLPR